MSKITYDHPRYKEIRDEVDNRFNRDFNNVQMANLRKVCECWVENVVMPDVTEENFEDFEHDVEIEKDEDGNIENYEEIEEGIRERIDENIYEIMWNTLFEAGDNLLADKLVKDEAVMRLYDMGITVIDLRDTDYEECYNTGVFLGVRGCGYDFYEAHWVPLYVEVLKWVSE